MHELIFEELKMDFEDRIRQKGEEMKQQCYRQQGKGLDGVWEYSRCIKKSKDELGEFEKEGKYRMLWMEMASEKSQDFNLVESVSSFI